MTRRSAAIAASTAALLLSACAYVKTPPLKTYDVRKGYRFDSLPLNPPNASKNSEGLFVMLAFSGGGTRASAMSYGALAQLRAVKFHVDPATGEPVACAATESAACRATERSLLDEVDVISSVSGGSFTSAYYALYGDSIFNRQSTFQDKFLYHRVQSDLLKEMVYYPKNWKRLMSRIEIAADYHASNIFGDATFAQLERRPRPYLILNATDASTGGRFEFSQEQFDLLCVDLSQVPVARGVASSSAFPALLNSMPVDSYNAKGGCNYQTPTWETRALQDLNVNPLRYRAALQQQRFRDPARKHLHLLDGGLADNLGLRAMIQSLASTDQPNQRFADGSSALGGWSLLRRIQNVPIKRVLVITVDARTNHPKDWDTKAKGPGIVSVVNAAASIPMGNFTSETLELMRAAVREHASEFEGVSFSAMSLSLDDVVPDAEREFLNAAGTNFELPEFTVNCLMSRSARLLRDSRIVNTGDSVMTFAQFVGNVLKGTVTPANLPSPEACTEAAGKKAIKASSHTIDIALRYNMTQKFRDDVEERANVWLNVRVAKPNGLGATVAFTWPQFVIPTTIGDKKFTLGRLRLYGIMAGPVVSQQLGPIEISAGASAGYGFGNFRTSAVARSVFAEQGMGGLKTSASSTWLVKPNATLWYSLTGKIGATVSASYLFARPTLSFDGASAPPDRKIQLNAFQLNAGLGYRIF